MPPSTIYARLQVAARPGLRSCPVYITTCCWRAGRQACLTLRKSLRPAPSVAPRFGMPAPIEPLPSGIAGRTLVRVRALPVAAADPLARDWSRAQTPNATRGPFVNDAGQRFWIDTFVLPELVDIVAATGIAGAARLLARLPLRRGRAPVRRRQLAAGSVWLSANVLVKNRPPSEFVGARVTGGSLELQGVSSVSGSVITLGGAWRMKIVLKLAAPPTSAATTGPGVDAADAVVTLPAAVTITLDASGVCRSVSARQKQTRTAPPSTLMPRPRRRSTTRCRDRSLFRARRRRRNSISRPCVPRRCGLRGAHPLRAAGGHCLLPSRRRWRSAKRQAQASLARAQRPPRRAVDGFAEAGPSSAFGPWPFAGIDRPVGRRRAG